VSRVERQFAATGLVPGDLADRLERLEWKKVQREHERFEARQGSQVTTRRLGDWSVNARKLPKRLVADRVGGGMNVTIEESMGIGG